MNFTCWVFYFCGIPLKCIRFFPSRHFKLLIHLIFLGFQASFRSNFYSRTTFPPVSVCGPSGVIFNSLHIQWGSSPFAGGEHVEILALCQLWEFFVLELPGSFFSLEVLLGWSQEILPFSCTGFIQLNIQGNPHLNDSNSFPALWNSTPQILASLTSWYCFLCLLKSIRLPGSILVLSPVLELLPGWEPWMMVGLAFLTSLFSGTVVPHWLCLKIVPSCTLYGVLVVFSGRIILDCTYSRPQKQKLNHFRISFNAKTVYKILKLSNSYYFLYNNILFTSQYYYKWYCINCWNC